MTRLPKRSRVSEDEPRWTSEKGENQLAEMLNWYSYNRDSEDARRYFLDHLKSLGETHETITQIAECSDFQLKNSLGWLSRISAVNGDAVPEKFRSRLKEETTRVLQLVSTEAKQQAAEKAEKKSSAPRLTVQDHLENQLLGHLSELAYKVDEAVSSRFKLKFDMYEWLKSQSIKHQHAKSIAEHYENTLLAELLEAQSGTCPQLTEGYAFLSKSEMKKYIAFIQMIISESLRWADVAKQILMNNRAPRKRKPKPPGKQVERLQFLREHDNLKSIPATQIVGATQLWVYNVKTRTLGVYTCTNAHGFSVKGCSILNFDINESICKRLRKPEEVLPKVLEAGKVALRKILPNIRTKEKKLTGRINKDTILLKAL